MSRVTAISMILLFVLAGHAAAQSSISGTNNADAANDALTGSTQVQAPANSTAESVTNSTAAPAGSSIPSVSAEGTYSNTSAQPTAAANTNNNATPSVTTGSSDAVNLCSGDGGFVSLSCIPGFAQAAGTNGLANFFNLLYDLCIGAAAVIAVLQITRAGIMYMGSDSFTEKKDAKHLIAVSLMGMVLVLSPALILGIINPKINTLNLDTSGLTVTSAASTGAGGNAGANTENTVPPTQTTSNGCTITGTFLKQASCPTQQAAQDFVASCTNSQGSVLPCQTENSSGCADTTFRASCNGTAGPYIFIDTAQSGFTWSGIANALVGYSHYEPLAKSASSESNGADVLHFASSCTSDGGSVCMSDSISSVPCTFTTAQSTSQSNACYSKTLTCKVASTVEGLTSCSKNPDFTVIQ